MDLHVPIILSLYRPSQQQLTILSLYRTNSWAVKFEALKLQIAAKAAECFVLARFEVPLRDCFWQKTLALVERLRFVHCNCVLVITVLLPHLWHTGWRDGRAAESYIEGLNTLSDSLTCSSCNAATRSLLVQLVTSLRVVVTYYGI